MSRTKHVYNDRNFYAWKFESCLWLYHPYKDLHYGKSGKQLMKEDSTKWRRLQNKRLLNIEVENV